jgi:methyl-accepting chemotaxis protein
MFLIILTTLGVILYPLIIDMFMSDDIDTQYQAAQTFIMLMRRLVPAVVIMFSVVFLHQVSITHRICGPLVNFTNSFRKISEGDLTRKVFLRQGDYLKKECQRINEMIDGLVILVSRFRADHGRLISVLEKAREHAKDLETKKQVGKALEIIRREAQLVTKDLEIFRLENKSQASDTDINFKNKGPQ